MSQLCESTEFAYPSKNLLRLNMQWQCSLNSKRRCKNLALYSSRSLKYAELHVVLMTGKKYSGIPIFRISRGNANWFEKSGVREIEGGIKLRLIGRVLFGYE